MLKLNYFSIIVDYFEAIRLLLFDFPQSLYNSQKEWEKCVFDYSVRNQLRYRGNIGGYKAFTFKSSLSIFYRTMFKPNFLLCNERGKGFNSFV